MIKKIQEYLLLRYPTIWNIRLIPMLLILIGIHFIFLLIAYLLTDFTFNEDKHISFSPNNQLKLLYFSGVLVGLLLLIGWLVFYNRNNALKSLYPRKVFQIFMEWTLIFIITAGITLIPLTITEGCYFKLKTVMPQDQVLEAIDILEKVNILIPNDKDYYIFNEGYDTPIPIKDSVVSNTQHLNLSLYETESNPKNGIVLKSYIGPSLLFASKHYYNHYDTNSLQLAIERKEAKQKENTITINRWLRNGQKDSIYDAMKQFNELQQIHKFTVNITPEEWLERIYHPPFFPVNRQTIIKNYKPDQEYYGYDVNPVSVETIASDSTLVDDSELDETLTQTLPYLQYNELIDSYSGILKYYYSERTYLQNISLSCLCVAICISMFIYSYRITNSKSWLIALISGGILAFFVLLIGIFLGESVAWKDRELVIMLGCLFWVGLFILSFIKILSKIRNNNKGFSNIYMNIMLWLTPCIIPLLYFTYYAYSIYKDGYQAKEDYNIETMFWINLAITIISMMLISILVRKWKGVPEE